VVFPKEEDMRFEGSVLINAPRQRVWDFIMDVENLASCIPGCEEIEKVDEKTFRSRITNRVAFLSVKFNSTTTITEIAPPESLNAVTRGKDNIVHTSVNMKSGLELEAPSEDETRLSYWSDVNIVGKLATFGESTIRGKAKKVLNEFEEKIKAKVEAD
jgi:carbon monoxide dehydrogenase subunit G